MGSNYNPRKSRRVAATAHGAIHAPTRPLLVVVVGGLPDIVRPRPGRATDPIDSPHDCWCPGYRVAPLPPVAVVQTVGERVGGSAVSWGIRQCHSAAMTGEWEGRPAKRWAQRWMASAEWSDVASVVYAMLADLDANPHAWENDTLERFLEAFAALELGLQTS